MSTHQLTDMAAGMLAGLAPKVKELVDVRLSRVSELVDTAMMREYIMWANRVLADEKAYEADFAAHYVENPNEKFIPIRELRDQIALQIPPTEPEIASALIVCSGVSEVAMLIRRLAFQRDALVANLQRALTPVEDTPSKPAIPHNAVCFFEDGNKWCAVFGDFVNLQESPAGFGDNHEEALLALQAEHDQLKRL